MNKIIFEQLKKCKVAKLPFFDMNTTTIQIEKGGNAIVSNDLEINHYYRIQVEDYIVKPYEGFTLHDNWNNGIVPTDNIMNCEVIQIMGKMVKVEAVGFSTNVPWCGWLPRKSIHIIEEID